MWDTTVRLWETATGTQLHVLTGPGTTRMTFSPSGELLAAADEYGKVHVWETATGALALELSHPSLPGYGRRNYPFGDEYDGIYDVAFNRTGQLLATARGEGSVFLWDISTGRQASEPAFSPTPDIRPAGLASIMFTSDGRLLTAIRGRGKLSLGDLTANKPLSPLSGFSPDSELYNVTFSPDGHMVAACDFQPGPGMERHVLVWDAATGDVLQTFPDFGYIQDISFSPDNRLIAVAGVGGISVQLWEIVTGKVLHTIAGHIHEGVFQETCSVAFSPDGRLLATAGYDGTARIWN
jgi:WD40 repeat protein